MDGMIVAPKTVARYGFKCGCCVLHKAKARCGGGRDRERRMLKRRERLIVAREVEEVLA